MVQYSTEDALQDIPKWVEKINQVIDATKAGAHRTWKSNLEDCTKPPTLTIAVLGGTGAGKSSLLNAILEADVVPTSGNRARTSVITEITYHDGPDHQADVHFILNEDWERDLEVYVADILDEYEKKHKNKVTDEARKSWDALTAVYRTLTWKQLVESSNHEFLKDAEKWPSLKCLGTTKHITCDNPLTFSKEVRGWTGDKGSWSLIRKVSLRCTSHVLATGVTLVDLPGIGDSNAARRAVAEGFIKNSDHFFVVLPITRAVDAQITSELLGVSKIQFKLDGAFQASKITFIVTKCDSLSYEEVFKSLQLEEEPEFVELREHLLQMPEKNKDSTG